MSDKSQPSISPSANSAAQSPGSGGSAGEGHARKTKIGRPNLWTPSRQRELVRLYLYSILPPKDIPKALKEEGWLPGKESTVKTVNSLLNHDPRWLRPKNREEMDKRILALSECKAQRRHRRNQSSLDSVAQGNQALVPDAISSIEFSETPLEDLLAYAPQEPYKSITNPSIALSNTGQESSSGSDGESSLVPTAGQDSSDSEPTSDASAPELSADEKSIKSLSTDISMTSLRERLSQYSTTYVKAIARLMKAHSISDSSAATTITPAYAPSLTTADGSTIGTRTICSSSSTKVLTQVARPVLANVFLTLDSLIRRQGVCFPGLKSHDANNCWCAVADEVEAERTRIWVCKEGPLRSLDQYLDHLHFRDKFGNSGLHVLAARDANIHAIVEALEAGVDGNTKNAAGQNFLHVLPRRFLRTLAEDDWNGLMWVLQKLNRFKIRFHDCDIFGRSFFHLLTHRGKVLDQNELQVLKFLHVKLLPSRDAFGWVPTVESGAQINFDDNSGRLSSESGWPVMVDEYTSNQAVRMPLVENGSPASAVLRSESPASSDEMSFIFKHARLIEIARIAFVAPHIEDPEGRNGLQCLAEASLTLSIDSDNVPSGSSHKRKRDQSDIDPSSTRLTLRYELVQQLVFGGVDLNNYDTQGNTVLMAFINHLHDGEDDKTLGKLFRHLINNGANLHFRNRQGESALHIAVRLGRKVATRVLLENGANVHARTPEGKGILAVGETSYFRARDNQSLYASIHACMALAVQYGAKAAPTLVQEWTLEDEESE